MNNCIYLKQKLNRKLECKKSKKIININVCNNCKFKEYKTYNKTIKSRSSTLAKLEKNRFSIFTDDLEHCIICGQKKDNLHEIFFGRNRAKSMKLGFVIPLCFKCHYEMHINSEWQEFWHKKGQLYFEEHLGSRNDFIRLFGENYINYCIKKEE